MKHSVLLLAFMLFLFIGTTSLLAQSATPEAGPFTMSALFASLPQSRTADGGFVVGQPTAPITIIEFVDYACNHCQDYRPTIEHILREYLPGGQIRFELRILPTAGGQLTYYVGQLQECINHQRLGTFWQAYDHLYDYATSGRYDQNVAQRLSDDFGLNYDKLLRCAQSASQVAADTSLARQFGVTGTPAIMVRYGDSDPQSIRFGKTAYSGGGIPFNVIRQVIEAANANGLPSNI